MMERWFRIVYIKDDRLCKEIGTVKDVSEALTTLDKYIGYTIIEFSYYHV